MAAGNEASENAERRGDDEHVDQLDDTQVDKNDDWHGGEQVVEVARAHGVETVFTLTGAHIFPVYDAARSASLRLLDVRHEQTAAFAAEATGRLTRRPGFAAVTAGPGVTNAISAITQAHRAGSPLVVLGGRAATEHWGWGSLQELDHPALLRPITKHARTISEVDQILGGLDEAFRVAGTPHRGPAFVDVPIDRLYSRTAVGVPSGPPVSEPRTPEPDVLAEIATLLAAASRPLLVLGSDIWLDGAETAALELAEALGIPTVTNGMARGVLPPGHRLAANRARKALSAECDLAMVIGTPLDFRVDYGVFGTGGTPQAGAGESAGAGVIHVVDSPDQLATHLQPVISATGDLATTLYGLRTAWDQVLRRPDRSDWIERLRVADADSRASDAGLLTADTEPIHPARILGELNQLLADDAVVIGDGGDFVSFAGRFCEPARPGCWLDPGPYGCLGGGVGAAIAARLARPSSQVALLLGDGAAGLSLLDVDTLVRHRLPVLIVVGNNACWGLERQTMRMLYGYDVAAELAEATRYDAVVEALGGAGETVTAPAQIGPALRRGFDANVPYLVNVACDPQAGYPRRTFGV